MATVWATAATSAPGPSIQSASTCAVAAIRWAVLPVTTNVDTRCPFAARIPEPARYLLHASRVRPAQLTTYRRPARLPPRHGEFCGNVKPGRRGIDSRIPLREMQIGDVVPPASPFTMIPWRPLPDDRCWFSPHPTRMRPSPRWRRGARAHPIGSPSTAGSMGLTTTSPSAPWPPDRKASAIISPGRRISGAVTPLGLCRPADAEPRTTVPAPGRRRATRSITVEARHPGALPQSSAASNAAHLALRGDSNPGRYKDFGPGRRVIPLTGESQIGLCAASTLTRQAHSHRNDDEQAVSTATAGPIPTGGDALT